MMWALTGGSQQTEQWNWKVERIITFRRSYAARFFEGWIARVLVKPYLLCRLPLFIWLSRSAGTFLRLSRYQHVSSWLLSFSADHHLWLHFYIRIHCSLVICKDACLFVIDSSLPHAHFYRQVFSLLLRLPLFKWLSNSAGTFLENRNIDDISFLM